MLERKTQIDMIEKSRNGYTGVRIALLIVDGEAELSKRWHRVSIAPEDDPISVLRDTNLHLQCSGEAELSAESIEMVAAEHKPAADWPE